MLKEPGEQGDARRNLENQEQEKSIEQRVKGTQRIGSMSNLENEEQDEPGK